MLEVELKLELSKEAAAALRDAGVLSGEPEVRALQAIYFDTPDHALANAGFSLRIRRFGDERIQTVKADGAAAAGLFVRSEWEAPVTGDAPMLDHTTPIKALLGDRTTEIGPLFEVNVERRIWLVHQGDAEIEVVLDSGEVVAGKRRGPVSEIELELKKGAPAQLFEMARKLDAVAPLRIGVLSKAERGSRLGGRSRSAFKAERVVLDDDATAATAFVQIAQACLRQFRLNENTLLEERSPKALHQARVALRRLRSAFSIFKPMFGRDEHATALRSDLRWLAGEMGEARNLDVMLTRTGQGSLHDRLLPARKAAYDQAEAALTSSRARGIMLDLVEWLTDGAWLRAGKTEDQRNESARIFASASLRRFRRKVKRGGRHLESLGDEARHDVRKDAKKLRYASEFFASLFDTKPGRKRYKRFIAALEELQDQLGALNDIATAPDQLRRIGMEDAEGTQALLGAERRSELLDAAAAAHEALTDAKLFWR